MKLKPYLKHFAKINTVYDFDLVLFLI